MVKLNFTVLNGPEGSCEHNLIKLQSIRVQLFIAVQHEECPTWHARL